MTTLSIVMCTYNGEKYIKEQIESILKQTYSNFSLIIVDDCSTDKTINIIEHFSESDNRIKLYKNKKNLGLNKNFEKGIKLASSEYIAISDQDDIWNESKIEKQLNLIKKEKLSLVYCDSLSFSEDGKINHRSQDSWNYIKTNNPLNLLINNIVSGHQIIFHKSLLEYILPIPSTIYYDWWIAYNAAGLNGINYVDEVLVKYRQHTENFTVKNKIKKSRTTLLKYRLNNIKTLSTSYFSEKNRELIDDIIYSLEYKINNQFSFKYFYLLIKNRNTLMKVRFNDSYPYMKKLRNYFKVAAGLKY